MLFYLAFNDFAFFKHSFCRKRRLLKRVPYLFIFVIRENEILIAVIRDSLFFLFVNCARDPLYDPLLRTLVTGSKSGDNDRKYTETFKFKEALPVLSFISHIRNQRSSSDFPVLFDLLLIAHGGEKSLISLLASNWVV